MTICCQFCLQTFLSGRKNCLRNSVGKFEDIIFFFSSLILAFCCSKTAVLYLHFIFDCICPCLSGYCPSFQYIQQSTLHVNTPVKKWKLSECLYAHHWQLHANTLPGKKSRWCQVNYSAISHNCQSSILVTHCLVQLLQSLYHTVTQAQCHSFNPAPRPEQSTLKSAFTPVSGN